MRVNTAQVLSGGAEDEGGRSGQGEEGVVKWGLRGLAGVDSSCGVCIWKHTTCAERSSQRSPGLTRRCQKTAAGDGPDVDGQRGREEDSLEKTRSAPSSEKHGGVSTSRSRALTAFVCPVEPRTQDRQRDGDGEDGGEGASEHSSCQEHRAANREEAPRWTVPGWCSAFPPPW